MSSNIDDQEIADELFAALGNLNLGRARGEQALHKPLLLLVALRHLASGAPRLLPYNQVEQQLARLGNQAGLTEPLRAYYPFWRLQRDSVWEVPEAGTLATNASGDVRVSELRANNVSGGFPVRYDVLLRRRPDVLADVVRRTLGLLPEQTRARLA